jgi:hypothetical protein
MQKMLPAFFLAVLITGCVEPGSADYSSDEETGGDSEHVGYYNPNTGYSSDYTLDVDRDSDGEVERINFPNGGYEDDIVDQEDNGDGKVTVTDEDGREFTVEND